MNVKRTLLIALLAFFLTACAPHVEQRELLAMGTVVSIGIVDASPADARQAFSAIEADMQALGRDWYPWSDGELKRLNAALAAGQAFHAQPKLAELLRTARQVFDASDGAFDPAIAPMVERWGFQDAEHLPAQMLSAAQLAEWSARRATFADLKIDGNTVRSARRDLMIDLGAIGKGRVVDLAVETLRSHGIQRALVNAGGNLRGIGTGPKQAWRIAIRDPRGENPLGWVDLHDDESVSTSGDYERYAIVDGQRVHHLLDPRTGQSATHTLAVTVVARDATTADAASTALFVAGPDRWRSVAKRLSVNAALRIAADGRIEVTRALYERLHVSQHTLPLHVVEL